MQEIVLKYLPNLSVLQTYYFVTFAKKLQDFKLQLSDLKFFKKIMGNIIAIVGRPNVGKSTLYNRLIGGRNAIIDDTSGVTRDRKYGLSEWNGKNFTVI